MRVLLIEDDSMIGSSLTLALKREGMGNGVDGAETLVSGGHGLVLLYLGLPGRSGLDCPEGGASRRQSNTCARRHRS